MAFFKQFPRSLYVVDGTLVNIPDLFRRVVPTDLFDNMSYMDEYSIEDGQKPEHISFDLYDSVDYYWLILLCNNIIDPYHDWPKSNLDLIEFSKQRYGDDNLNKVHHYVDSSNEDIRVNYDETKFNLNQIRIVTNIEHETNINEEKRRIKLPKPEVIEELAGQFKRLIRGR
ncbi:MAG: hypothetical protein CMA64_07835 [Euryarchaeota archaeon]|nr:hypothetical protein [Euryarchaeota archaeon]